MERQDDQELRNESDAKPEEKRPYEAPKIESVRLTKEAAESLT